MAAITGWVPMLCGIRNRGSIAALVLPDKQGIAFQDSGDSQHGDFGVASTADGIDADTVHLGIDAFTKRPADPRQLERIDVEFED